MKPSYRPEIDGLRAIAVGAVILYHAQFNFLGYGFFKGGFIGVDIFFVISGYLITSIILRELIFTNTFSFINFYKRRLRRILPALLVVMLFSLPLAWMYLVPSSLINFSKSILYSLGISSNFYFNYSGQEYGATDGLLKPFLHTWSLSVEEQFYIIFPIILLISFRYLRKYLIFIIFSGFLISLLFGVSTGRHYPSISFYFLHTRMWELLAGSILAYFEIKNGKRSKNKILNYTFPIIGLFLIFSSMIFFKLNIGFLTLYSLPAILGTCLIIWFSDENTIINKILSNKIFVGIGLISYSLYLWHYPVFAFERISEFSNNNIIGELLLGLIILILSIATYFFVEKPFRNKKYKFKYIFLILFVIIIFLTSFNLYIIKEDGIKKRLPEIVQVINPIKLMEKNYNFYQVDNLQKIVLIGDSHKQVLEYSLNEESKKNNLSLFHFNTMAYLNEFNFVNRYTKKINEKFIQNNKKIDIFLKENSNLIVILHHRWAIKMLETYYQNEEGYKEVSNLTYEHYLEPSKIKISTLEQRQKYVRDGFVSQINNIINQGHKLILIYPVPEMGFNVPKHLLKTIIKNKYRKNDSITILSESYEAYKKRNESIFEILDTVQNKNIYRVYPHKLFCDNQIKDRCVANDNKNLFYYDDDHLSLTGSELVIKEVIDKIKNIDFKAK